MESDPAQVADVRFVGARLAQARELRGLTQAQLAAQVLRPSEQGATAISRAAIAQYEAGLANPSAPVLGQLAAILGVERGFFTRAARGSDLPASFRSLRSAPAAERRKARQLAQCVHDVVSVISASVKLPEWHRGLEQADQLTPDQAAALARRTWGLNPGPVNDVVHVLESGGCICAVTPDVASEVDAFSVPFEPNPVVMLNSAKGKRDRSRFDAAHEAGHLLMHRHSAKDIAEQESEAHAFAAAFLMPADDIRGELPAKVDWVELTHLKVKWGVSLAALVKRCRDLERISAAQYTSAMKYMSMRGWRKQEPTDLGPCEEPRLLRQAALQAGLGAPGIASALHMPAKDVEWIVGNTFDTRGRVVF